VVLSGGNNLVLEKVPEQYEAEVMRQLLLEWGIPDASVEEKAVNQTHVRMRCLVNRAR